MSGASASRSTAASSSKVKCRETPPDAAARAQLALEGHEAPRAPRHHEVPVQARRDGLHARAQAAAPASITSGRPRLRPDAARDSRRSERRSTMVVVAGCLKLLRYVVLLIFSKLRPGC